MKTTKEAMYAVASGKIEDPSIELEIEGQKQSFSGCDAQIFAFGVLAGMKYMEPGANAKLEVNTVNEEKP